MTWNVHSMPSHDSTYIDLWPGAAAAGMVSADPVRRVATHVDGPTLYEREPGFGCGIASVDRAPTCNGRSNPTSAAAGPGRRSFRIACAIGCVITSLLIQGCGGSDAGTDAAGAGTGTQTQTPASGQPANDASSSTVANTGTPAAGTTTDPNASAGAAANPQATTAGTLQNEILTAGDQVKTSKATPRGFVKALGRRAIIVVMYQPGETASQQMLAEVAAATRSRTDVLVLKYTPADYASYGDLADQLDLFDIPSLAIVDRAGKLQNMRARFWPSNLIARSLDIARKVAPAKVSPADAPADNGIDSMESATSSASSAVSTPGV